MDYITLVNNLVIGFIGVALGYILKYMLGSRKQNIDEFKLLLDEYKLRLQEYKTIADGLVKKNEKLEVRIRQLEERHNIFHKLEIALRKEISELREQNRNLKEITNDKT